MFENFSANASVYSRSGAQDLNAFKIFNIAFTLVSLYFSVAFTWRGIQIQRRSRGGCVTGAKDEYELWIRILLTTAMYAAFLRYIAAVLLSFNPPMPEELCVIIIHTNYFAIIICDLFITGAFFVQQRILYQADRINSISLLKLIGKTGEVFYAGFLIVNILFVAFFTTFTTIGLDSGVCKIVEDRINVDYIKIMVLSGVCVTDFGLIIILALPLINLHVSGKIHSIQERILCKDIIKTLICAGGFVLTELASFVLLRFNENIFFNPDIINICLFLDVCIPIFLFHDWKNYFFPMFAFNEEETNLSRLEME